MNFSEAFSYDESTGSLIWKAKKQKVVQGTPAGSPDRDGYLNVQLNGIRHKVHRVIWEMLNGEIPDGMQIDHINGVKNDNRIDNLRLVPGKENAKNRSRLSTNKSGINGVCWQHSRLKWQAYIAVDGVDKHLGRYSTLLDAVAARKSAEAKHGFHANHGRG